jgi:hypothetical protein
MARRVYTPRGRTNKGANIRIGHCETVDHIDRPVGSDLLRRTGLHDGEEVPGNDYCGAVVRSGVPNFGASDMYFVLVSGTWEPAYRDGAASIARNSMRGRDQNYVYSYGAFVPFGPGAEPGGGGGGGGGPEPTGSSPPSAPLNFRVLVQDSGSLIIAFDPPASSGSSGLKRFTTTGSNGYIVTENFTPGFMSQSQLTATFLSLSASTTYSFSVAATNAQDLQGPYAALTGATSVASTSSIPDVLSVNGQTGYFRILQDVGLILSGNYLDLVTHIQFDDWGPDNDGPPDYNTIAPAQTVPQILIPITPDDLAVPFTTVTGTIEISSGTINNLLTNYGLLNNEYYRFLLTY